MCSSYSDVEIISRKNVSSFFFVNRKSPAYVMSPPCETKMALLPVSRSTKARKSHILMIFQCIFRGHAKMKNQKSHLIAVLSWKTNFFFLRHLSLKVKCFEKVDIEHSV